MSAAAEQSAQERIDAINASVQKKQEDAAKLLEYLKVQRSAAQVAEEKEEEDLKRRGIIIGQHVPSLPSQLSIDHREVQQFENFAPTLLIAKDLVAQNRDNFLRRTGNRAISDLAETKRQQNAKRRAETVDNAPNYMMKTNSATFRNERANQRFANTLSVSRELVETRRLEMSLTGEKKKPLKQKKVLNAEQRLANENILKSINHKMNYLRNPRNDPAGVSRMLVKSKAQVEKVGQSAVDADDHASNATGMASRVSGATNLTSTATSTNASSARKKKYGKPEKLDNNPLFVAEPSMVFFSSYDIGGTYRKTISFRNVSAVTRTLRVTAPKNYAFTLSPLRYPSNCRGGMVAPGMSVSATIIFNPTTLNDFMSSITVETESGSIEVPLSAQREPPKLSIPSFLDVGSVLVGDAQRLSITCVNSGGGGRFRLLTPAQNERYERAAAAAEKAIEAAAAASKLTGKSVAETSASLKTRSLASKSIVSASVDDISRSESPRDFTARKETDESVEEDEGSFGLDDEQQVHDEEESNQDAEDEEGGRSCLRLAPFTVYPVDFTLMKGESIDINIEFVPLELQRYEAVFFMQCDNGQVRKFSLFGESRIINTSISAINNVDFDPTDRLVFPDMTFSPNFIGCEQSQQMVVVNDTGLPIEYEWVFIDQDLSAIKDIDTASRQQIYERERQQRGTASVLHIDSSQSRDNSPVNLPTLYPEVFDGSLIPSPEKRRLIKSLQMTLQGDNDRATSSHLKNAVEVDGFEVSPARGVLPGEGAETFSFSFCPHSIDLIGKRAVMVIKSIPPAALPSLEQAKYLQVLANDGHGSVLRCRSWIEELGIPAEVEEYIKPNASPSTSKNLLSLQTLINLVLSHVATTESKVIAEECARINRWTRQIIQFVENVRKIESVVMDEGSSIGGKSVRSMASSVNAPATVDGNAFLMSFFDWTPDGSDDAPHLLPPLKLYRVSDDEDEQHVEIDDSGPQLRNFNTAQRSMLNEIWLDNNTAITLLGREICLRLDEKVSHECVDYIKETALMHMASLSFNLFGEGKRQNISLRPPVLEVGGLLPIGKNWTGEVRLVNPTPSTAEIDVLTSEIICYRVFSTASSAHDFDEAEYQMHDDASSASSAIDSSQPLPRMTPITPREAQELISFVPEHERILVMPNSEVTVKFSLKLNSLGRFQIVVPLNPRNPFSSVDDIILSAQTGGPRLRFHEAEVDLSLIGVGNEGIKKLTFTNEGEIPAMFMLKPQLHLDFSAGKNSSGNNTQRSKQSGGSRQNTQRDGNLSRMSSTRTDDFSVADSQASSNGDFKIEMKNAVVTVDPPSGVVQPHQTFSVNVVCKAGKIPQRIRGLIEGRICDEFGKVESTRQYLNMRGEVQAPKTKMYPVVTSLGQVYVGQPVKFSICIENMCNLPTMYKLLRPGGESSLYRLQFDKHKGPLGAKEIVQVQCTFTSLATGMIDDIISNKIFGVKVPLAFEVKALSKGVSLEFAPMEEDEKPPAPLASPNDTQLPNNAKPPEPKSIEPLLLGDEVPLYKRRKIRFYIRNLSAIAVPFSLRARKFSVQEKKIRFPGSSVAQQPSISTARSMLERTDLTIAPHEGGMEKFHSQAGKEYLGATVYRQEDKEFLYSGLGASYHIDVLDGELAPWGVQVVTISAYNDIPGCYDDEIECIITEGEVKRSILVPIKMSVVGCPMVIDTTTVGMTKVHHTSTHKDLIGRSLLHLGFTTVHAEPLVREFYVKNHGSKDGKIRWHAKNVTSQMKGPLKVSLDFDGGSGRVSPKVQFWEDLAKDSPFRIEPAFAVIPPYGKKKFTVTLFRTDNFGTELAELSGKIKFNDDIVTADTGDNQSTSSSQKGGMVEAAPAVFGAGDGASLASTSISQFTVQLLVQGDFQHPTINLEKHTYSAHINPTVVEKERGLFLKAKAPLLFSKGCMPADVCNKELTVSNPSEAKLLFSVSTQGPFSIREIASDGKAAQSRQIQRVLHGASVTTDGDEGSQLLSPTTHITASKSSVGKTYNLFPNENGTFQVAFNPKRDLREKLLSQFGSEAGMPTEERGALIFSYSTGQSLHVPLITRISTPFLAASSPRMYFGVCRVTRGTDGIILLRNPTDVPAHWSVSHVPGQGAWRRTTAIRVGGFEDPASTETDDPTVFEITPSSGVVEGPSVSTTAAMSAPPVDMNRSPNTIVQQRTVKTSWALNTLTTKDSLELRHSTSGAAAADANYPMPITVRFTPKKSAKYSSRFRFTCEFANTFDLVLQGEGTYEEHLHKPLRPVPTD